MSGDIFKKAFSKASEEERQRNLDDRKRSKIQRERTEEIREKVESVISQIPSVFEVSRVHFNTKAEFMVTIPRGETHVYVSVMYEPTDTGVREMLLEKGLDEYRSLRWSSSIILINMVNLPTPPDANSGWVLRDQAIEWMASELGRILAEEYEGHRGFYKRMEDGL